MALPQLTYEPTSQNQRVQSLEVPGDEQPRLFTVENLPDGGEMEALIQAAYRQIFNEQQVIASNRLPWLESQLKMGQITVKGFIRGLMTSVTFRDRIYGVNNNYRFVRMCLQRALGREAYSDREVLSWSIVVATKGLYGFIDDLLSSDEYMTAFGETSVPYQRRRILPQRTQGEVTFAHTPRYGADHLAQLKSIGHEFERTGAPITYRWAWQRPPYSKAFRYLAAGVSAAAAVTVSLATTSVVLSWFGWIHI